MARPREFDEGVALESALQTFWTKGYTGSSARDLSQATGLHPGSLYAAFGSKAELLRRCLADYLQRGLHGLRQSIAEASEPLTGIRAWLEAAVFHGEGDCRGCFAVNSAVAIADEDEAVGQMLARHESALEQTLAQALAAESGDPEQALQDARLIVMGISGIQVAARNGAPPERLRQLLETLFVRLS
jgi:TetR/AcrR family transcriptional repressor of nem operon